MPKARLVFDGDNVYIGKDARIYGLKDDIASKIDGIPGVVDNLDSTSTTDALSANMGRTLQDQINGLSGTGKFLSTWDCTTGLPGTNPQEDPYTYKVGDYYVVSVVGSTNYKPHGGTYTQGVPSTTVELENVGVNDKYYFDGADWVRIPDTAIQISIDSALDTTSTNAVENRAIATAINGKQNTISDLATIRSGAASGATALQPNANISQLTNNVGYQTAGDVASAIAGKQDKLTAGDGISLLNNIVTNTKPGPAISSIAPSNPTEGMLRYDSTNDILKAYDGSAWQEVGSDAADINTKTFHLSSLSDLTTAQAIWDFYRNGGNPIIKYSGRQYFQTSVDDFSLIGSSVFASPVYHTHTSSANIGSSVFHPYFLQFNLDQNKLVVESVQENEIYDLSRLHVLTTDTDYQTPYTPQYNGSPATKKYVDDSVADVIPSGGTAPQNPQEGDLWYDTVNHVLKIYNGTTWETVDTDSDTTYTAGNGINIDANNEISVDTTIIPTQADLAGKQDVLTAGDNIQISAQNVISATNTTYTAGEGIEIKSGDSYAAMRGPCPSGFHIPTISEWTQVNTIMNAFSFTTGDDWRLKLLLPFAGHRYTDSNTTDQGTLGHYRSVTAATTTQPRARRLFINSSTRNISNQDGRNYGYSIRPFKDVSVTPNSGWATLYDGSSIAAGAGIFRNATLGLISMSGDGTTWITIADKNLGAAIAYSNGATLSETNCGHYYQWGNNYGFAWTGAVITSSTQVDASNYGPGNYYISSTFIISSDTDWSSVKNDNLWGGETGVVQLHNAITNTGVTSVNGQTGDVVSAIVSNIMPSKPKEGMLWYDTANSVLKIYYNSNWVNV